MNQNLSKPKNNVNVLKTDTQQRLGYITLATINFRYGDKNESSIILMLHNIERKTASSIIS